MNFDKFKKKTNSVKMVSKCKRLDFTNLFRVLKVVEVVNYYTIEAVIYNLNSFHKVIFLLKDVDIFDDKLSLIQRDHLKDQLSNIILNKYFDFVLDDIFYESNQDIFNLKFIGTLTLHGEETKSTINTLVINNLINIFVLKDKIRKLNRDEGIHFKSKNKKIDYKDSKNLVKLTDHLKLNTISE